MEKNFGNIAFYIRRPDERRKMKDRRLFLKQEFLDHNSERRINMVDRRIFKDRRKQLSETNNNFWKKAL